MNAPALPKDEKDTNDNSSISNNDGKMPAMGTPAKNGGGGAGGKGAAANTPRSVSQTTGGVTAVVGNADMSTSTSSAASSAALLLLASTNGTGSTSNDDEGVIAADPESSPGIVDGDADLNDGPQQIPVDGSSSIVEQSTKAASDDGGNNSSSEVVSGAIGDDDADGGADAEEEQEEEDEDESEYEYEDDDDAAFSGFLVQAEAHAGSSSAAADSSSSSAIIVEEDSSGNVVAMKSSAPAADKNNNNNNSKSSPTEAVTSDAGKKKWREPTKAAVNMSLRAEQETSGSKRRLAQDLYRIMNQDTQEAGFSLEPASEDSMELWNIKLFQFDDDSNLAKDMLVLGIDNVDLEMKFPEQYPFEPPFVRVVSPRFKRQTGFVMNGALCMELLTKDGWNPVNDIESVIVSIRSLLVVGDGRLQAAAELPKEEYQALLKAGQGGDKKHDGDDDADLKPKAKKQRTGNPPNKKQIGSYSSSEAQAAYSHLTDYHKKKGWDQSGWWSRKG
mmetsp:Transcript_26195/g.62233  ORF Transcript_26195/g.62233 Transcript_26195/m.62233 type:complete len:502 (+) Transcript_26195:109-1614(+)